MEPSFIPGSPHALSLGPSDSREQATSPSSLLLPPPPSSINPVARSPLFEMSSIMKQLPIKRGLSQHFQGKSQSFTALSNVRCLEDLAKPDKSQNKKLKSCNSHGSFSQKASSRMISKKSPKKAFSSMNSTGNSRFFGCRLQIPSGGTNSHHTKNSLLNG